MRKRKETHTNYENPRKVQKSTSFGSQGLHALNPYLMQPNFRELADKYKSTLGRYIQGDKHIDWQNAEAVKCLTETLLDHNHGLQS